MDIEFAQKLCALNNKFYETWADSFSNTRHNAWPGWKHCLEETRFFDSIKETVPAPSSGKDGKIPLRILDVACGNLRFETYLANQRQPRKIAVKALDSCSALAESADSIPSNISIEFQRCDLITSLQDNTLENKLAFCAEQDNRNSISEAMKADVTVSFGFMHHIPLMQWRIRFLEALLRATKSDGCICVSFWNFLNSPALAAKAKETHNQGIAYLDCNESQFEEGDYLLGWRNEPGAFRYCHNFTSDEIEIIIEALQPLAECTTRFSSDGRTGNLNEYLVLKKR